MAKKHRRNDKKKKLAERKCERDKKEEKEVEATMDDLDDYWMRLYDDAMTCVRGGLHPTFD